MNDRLRSLEMNVENATTPMERITALCDLWRETYRTDNVRGLEIGNEVIELSRSIDHDEGIAWGLMYTGWCNYTAGHHEQAIEEIGRAQRIFDRLGHAIGSADARGQLGQIYNRIGEKVRAYECFVASIAISEQSGRTSGVAWMQNALGLLYKDLGDHTRALEQLKLALTVFEELDDTMRSGLVLHNIGSTYYDLGNFTDSRNYLGRALEMRARIDDNHGRAITHFLLACASIEDGELTDALSHAREGRRAAKRLGGDFLIGCADALMGLVLRRGGEFERALRFNARAIRRLDATYAIVATLYERGETFRAAGDLRRAARSYRRALAVAEQREAAYWTIRAADRLAEMLEQLGRPRQANRYLRHALEVASPESRRGREAFTEPGALTGGEKRLMQEEIFKIRSTTLEQTIAMKQRELASSALHLVQKNELIDEIKKELRGVIGSRNGNEGELQKLIERIDEGHDMRLGWERFEQQFREANPNYISMLLRKYPTLTPTETKVCSLLRIDLSSKEIASILCITPRSVDIYRNRIRRKLGLGGGENLTSFLRRVSGV